MIKVTVIGVLTKDPTGTLDYTLFKLRPFGKEEVTIFTKESSVTSRASYREGARIRCEGRPSWNPFDDSHTLTINGGVDLSDLEDQLTIKVDGSIDHELEIEKDDADEGGGRYIPVEIRAPARGKDDQGNWGNVIVYVRAMVIGDAVDQLIDLEQKATPSYCFTGNLTAEPDYVRDQPAYYAEITSIEVSKKGGGESSEDAFWNAKPRGLANRKSMPVKSRKDNGGHADPKKRGGGVDPDLNEDLPF
jgi:hypothetical protein